MSDPIERRAPGFLLLGGIPRGPGLAARCRAGFLAWFSSVVFVSATSPERGHVRIELGLEYDLLIASAARAEQDDALFRDGSAAWKDGGLAIQAAAIEKHADTVLSYINKRFGVAADGENPVRRRATDRYGSSSGRACRTRFSSSTIGAPMRRSRTRSAAGSSPIPKASCARRNRSPPTTWI